MKLQRGIARVGVGIMLLGLGLTGGARPVMAGFGVSPSNIYHEYLKPGGHFEQKFTISRSEAPDNLEVIIEPSLEEMRDWFTFEPGMKFIFPRGQNRMSFTAIIDVPSDAAYKSYEGVLRVKAMTAGGVPGGVSIIKGARVDVELITTEINVSELEVTAMKMRDVTGGETLKLDVTATNRGNVDVSPTSRVTIMNLQQQPLEELEDKEFGTVGPNKTEVLTAEFETKLGTGEYFAEASVLLDGVTLRRERLVFRITDREATGEIEELGRWGEIAELFTGKSMVAKIAMGLLVAGLVLVIILWGKKWWLWLLLLLPILKKKNYLILKILAVGLMLAGVVTGAWYVMGKRGASEEEVAVEEEVVVESPVPSPSPTATAEPMVVKAPEGSESGAVQGVTTTSPLLVTAKEGELVYPIYREPDSTSQIVFYAHEGDDFAVVEERANWFRIVLPDATGGWLAKESVKSTTIEER